jgi:hypothetical protein
MMDRKVCVAAILACAVAAVPAALAAGSAPEVVSGGVGIGERQAMMEQFKDYNLQLGFAQPDGAFLADVNVTIRDRAGNVVWSGTTNGPLLFARLEPGTYVVEADFEGQSQKRTVTAGRSAGSMQYVRLRGGDPQEAAVGGGTRTRGGSSSAR